MVEKEGWIWGLVCREGLGIFDGRDVVDCGDVQSKGCGKDRCLTLGIEGMGLSLY